MALTQKERDRRRHEEALPAYNALMEHYPFGLEDLPGEIWRPIEDFDDYQVSTFGRVKSFKAKIPLILKPKLNRCYLSVCLCTNGKTKRCSILEPPTA